MPVDSKRIADTLAEIGLYLDAESVAFKPQAYAAAAYTIQTLDHAASELDRIHALADFAHLSYSIAQARHGCTTKKDIENALKGLKKHRP